MDTKIFQNSYVAFIITFVVLCVIFYFFEIGYTDEVSSNNKIVKHFSWKYPLAIALLVWLVWYFYLYPPEGESLVWDASFQEAPTSFSEKMAGGTGHINYQKINMVNWL